MSASSNADRSRSRGAEPRDQRDPEQGSREDSDDGKPDASEHRAPREGDQAASDQRTTSRKRGGPHRRALLIGGGIVLVLLIIAGLLWWLHARHFEDTDDAFIDARTVRVAPRVSGQVSKVLVTDNQVVHAGDVLVEIDPADARAMLDQAEAEVSQAQTALGQAEANVEVAEAQRRQAMANTVGTEAQARNAAQDLKRYQDLKASTPQAVAQGQLDQAVAASRNANAQREATRQQVESAMAQITAANAAVSGAKARVQTSQAQLQQARLNLDYTRVIAPVDGHIAHRTVAVGSYVSPGTQLLAIVPLHMWVTANFKEDQLELLRPGQSVRVHVDACPDGDLAAHVDSIQRGAGQAFSLLPAENATGNYVKVVQRVPVKIELEEVPRNCPIGPGMSVEPRVRVR